MASSNYCYIKKLVAARPLISLKDFMSKLGNWKRKVIMNYVAMFEKLSPVLVAEGNDQVL